MSSKPVVARISPVGNQQGRNDNVCICYLLEVMAKVLVRCGALRLGCHLSFWECLQSSNGMIRRSKFLTIGGPVQSIIFYGWVRSTVRVFRMRRRQGVAGSKVQLYQHEISS
jgi:hypothetical protein